MFKIFGQEGIDLLISRTNERAKRRLKKRSESYRKRWKDLDEGSLSTFLAAWLGLSVLRQSDRHLTKSGRTWISQLETGKLFGKLPINLWQLYSSHFVAHQHRDTILFKKSVREQRIRFYGADKFSEIVYSNSRKSRDPPASISGDETITRLYSKKATDIRMRTKKKNESGVLNQNLCGANDEYEGWKAGDPVGSGFTFANLAYPGKTFNRGSMFREKDMGNLIQLIFRCGEYFRGKDIELVTDSHFGHLVPIAYLRLLNVYTTSSFTPGARIGVSNIALLSKKKYTKEEKKVVLETEKKVLEENKDEFDPSEDSVEEAEMQDVVPYELPKKKESMRSVLSPLALFEKKLSKRNRGDFEVWQTTFRLLDKKNITLYLHAVNDSKPVFRVSSKYGTLPKVNMILTDKNKKRKEVATSGAHQSFRKRMGNNDQSDAKRAYLGMSARYYRHWPRHILAKTIEDGIINAYLNYLLDPQCPVESWPDFVIGLVQELIDSGADLRMRKKKFVGALKRYRGGNLKRPRAGSDEVLQRGLKCKGGKNTSSIKWLQPEKRTAQCAFCGRKKARIKCRACQTHLCMQLPKSSSGIDFPMNGPTCFQRYHAIVNYTN